MPTKPTAGADKSSEFDRNPVASSRNGPKTSLMHNSIDSKPNADRLGPAERIDPRIPLASERTFLAWVRTGLAMMGFGFVVARFGLFLRELAATANHPASVGHSGSVMMGVALAGLGVWVIVVAAFRYRRYNSALSGGRNVAPPSQIFGLTVAALLGLLGVLVVTYLLMI